MRYVSAQALAGAMLVPTAAKASTLGLVFDTQFSNSTNPASTAPWAGALFNDAPIGGITAGYDVRLTIFTNGPTTGLTGGEFLTETDFNISNLDASNSPSFSSILVSATNGALGVIGSTPASFSSNFFQADGDGKYDMSLNFATAPPDQRATTGNIYVIDIAWTGGTLLASNFNSLSAPGGNSAGPFYAATHIQGITTGEGSTWAGANRIPCVNCATPFDVPGGTPVPEPASLLLIGTGLLGTYRLRRKQKQ
jgi:hypothetical protein